MEIQLKHKYLTYKPTKKAGKSGNGNSTKKRPFYHKRGKPDVNEFQRVMVVDGLTGHAVMHWR